MPSLESFSPQAQETHLAQKAVDNLSNLKRQNLHSDKLKKHLAEAVKHLTESAGELNDRGTEERNRHAQKLIKLREDRKQEPEEQRLEHDAFQEQVDSLTQKMDQSIRNVIDDQMWIEDIPGAVQHVVDKSTEALAREAQRRLQAQDEDGDNDEDEDTARPPDPSDAPTTLLNDALSSQVTTWVNKSLTNRYAEHNDYKGFYRMVYDAKNPGEHAPPLPHHSLWFAAAEGRPHSTAPRATQSGAAGGNTQAQAENMDEDEEVMAVAEKVSTKCPLTLKTYRNPVTSTKCPHSFEKTAILEFINHSPLHHEGAQCVQCPQCTVLLNKNDLREDPVLLRKVKRIEEAEKRQEEAERRAEAEGGAHDVDEEDEDEDEIPRGTQRRRIVNLGSSPTRSVKRQNLRLKGEQGPSVIPQTQVDQGSDD